MQSSREALIPLDLPLGARSWDQRLELGMCSPPSCETQPGSGRSCILITQSLRSCSSFRRALEALMEL